MLSPIPIFFFLFNKTSNLLTYRRIWSLLHYISIHVSMGVFHINSYFYRYEYIDTIEKKSQTNKTKVIQARPYI